MLTHLIELFKYLLPVFQLDNCRRLYRVIVFIECIRTCDALHAVHIRQSVNYCLLICIDSSIVNKSLKVGLLSVPAAFVQLFGYGCGFLVAWWRRCVKGQDEFRAFEKTFYK